MTEVPPGSWQGGQHLGPGGERDLTQNPHTAEAVNSVPCLSFVLLITQGPQVVVGAMPSAATVAMVMAAHATFDL